MEKIADCLISADDSIREAMARINRDSRGIALVTDHSRRLLATITDGDIRRAILAGDQLDQTVASLVARKQQPPISASEDTSADEQVQLMQRHGIRQLPLLDQQGMIVGLTLLDELIQAPDCPIQAVIMAGGIGKRLRPLTDHTPKPMLPIRGKPLLERTISRLKMAGIRHINITTGYLPEKITSYFGSGNGMGVELNYVRESQPLGTAGALGLLRDSNETLLVLNGDILTGVDFRSMLDFHRRHKAELTVGVRQYGVEVPFGVVETDKGVVHSLREKPTVDFLVNAGVYLLEPSAKELIPSGQRFDMTDLIGMLLQSHRTVMSYPIVEYWIDIGRLDDFQRAEQEAGSLRWAS